MSSRIHSRRHRHGTSWVSGTSFSLRIRRPNGQAGTTNNSWYQLHTEPTIDPKTKSPCLLFRHPVEPGNASEGWMQPSWVNKIQQVKQEAGTTSKQSTKDEIEKHDNESDCWIVVDGRVYDATSVLSWRPGGAAAVLGHAVKSTTRPPLNSRAYTMRLHTQNWKVSSFPDHTSRDAKSVRMHPWCSYRQDKTKQSQKAQAKEATDCTSTRQRHRSTKAPVGALQAEESQLHFR